MNTRASLAGHINHCLRLITWVTVVLSLSGCFGNNQDLRDHFKEVSQRPGRPIPPIPEFKPAEKFIYPAHLKRRNPFFKYQVESARAANDKKKDDNAPDLTRTRQPLEGYKRSALRFVGVLKQGTVIWGIIQAPDEMVYKVRVGDYIGKNFGKVVKITKRNIDLVERVKVQKRWTKRPVKLNLVTKKFQYGIVVEK